MATDAHIDQPNPAGVEEMGARATEGPVVMLNLLKFKPNGGAERYGEYGAAVGSIVERIGGRVRFAGAAGTSLIGEDGWDLVLLVEYPTRQAMLDMVASPEYQAIEHLRTEALEDSRLVPMDETSLPGT